MRRFEYRALEVPTGGFWGGKVESQEIVLKLNELGEEGWEISTSFSTNLYEGKTHSVILILKRELAE
ncbi:DUF4177 domain-containing protein [Larkinella terrae]|uniref:DUF4177 domain-containing protein n=1 Tax=Larkinella terrae TaxID=2025311 RepID=A0A7K0ESD5_9BACT|nr:DUF4177 domain-containing protein [Larkinella terrae]MRS64431.1 DUF4177 domain-containing protein [Larkinella terrae]